MKAVVAVFFILGSIAIFAFAGLSTPINNGGSERDFLRLHIRANSNTPQDQQVKYLVKQRIVNELTPLFYNVNGKKDAMNRLARNLPFIEQVANGVLKENGFNYKAHAAVTSEHFPTRSYTVSNINMVLPAGLYDALILQLGEGTGDNWWCVIYPPLCFLQNNIGGSDGVRYRSRILEWFR